MDNAKTKKYLLFLITIFLLAILVVYWLARKATCDLNNFHFYLPDSLFEAKYRDNQGQIKTVNNSAVVDSIVTISIAIVLFILFRNLNKKRN